jgi:hypothetical protein
MYVVRVLVWRRLMDTFGWYYGVVYSETWLDIACHYYGVFPSCFMAMQIASDTALSGRNHDSG